MEEIRSTVRPKHHLQHVIAAGLLTPVIATNIARALGLFEDWYFPVIGLIYFGLAFAFAFLSPQRLLAQSTILYVLMPLGSFLDAATDNLLRDSGRNLWGLEVIVLLVFVPLPLLLGAVVGRHIAWRKRKGAGAE